MNINLTPEQERGANMYQNRNSWLSKLAGLLLIAVVVSVALGNASCPRSQRPPKEGGRTLQVEELSGGRVITSLGYGIQVNKGSTLQRRWFVLNDPSCPIRLSGVGINSVYKSSSIGGDYKYEPVGLASANEPITAFELRFLLFDVWGQHMQTLSGTQVSDVSGQIAVKDIGTWRAWENDVSEMLTAVSFVARVKRPDGSVWEYDPSSLLQQVGKIEVKLTEKELTPEREKPKN